MEEKRLRELALRAAHACAPTYTRFLEPPMEIACRAAANFAGCEVAFDGGYEGAERRVAGFYAGARKRFLSPSAVCAWIGTRATARPDIGISSGR